MAAPAYIDLQGQTPIQIDHAYNPLVTAFSRRLTTPTTVKKSAGAVGKVKGIPDVTGSITFMVPTAGIAEIMALDNFTISYPWAGATYLIQHCSWSEDDRNTNPAAGDNGMTVNFVGTSESPF